MIKRYNFFINHNPGSEDDGYIDNEESKDGEWVKYEDVESIIPEKEGIGCTEHLVHPIITLTEREDYIRRKTWNDCIDEINRRLNNG